MIRPRRGWIARAALAGWLGGLEAAVPLPKPATTAVSQSGQFVVQGLDAGLPGAGGAVRPVGEGPTVHLRPELLAVTCERVRKAVNLRLGYRDQPGMPVHVRLRAPRPGEDRIAITLAPYAEGWQMAVETPASVEWPRLVRALVEVALLDHACNGGKAVKAPAVPLWLAEGVDALIEAEFGRDLVVESQTAVNRSARRPDLLASSRTILAGREPLTFSDLSGAAEVSFPDAPAFERFRATSALMAFVLLETDENRAMTRAFVARLPDFLNWPLAFLAAGERRFSSLLDVERWWAMAADEALSRDPALHWPRNRVLQELWNVAAETADVRQQTNSPAARRTLKLSEIVDAWPYAAQRDVLQRKAAQLRALAAHAPKDLFPLVSDYYDAVSSYAEAREGVGRKPDGRMTFESRARIVAAGAKRRFLELERRLAAAAPPPRAF